MCHEGAYRFGGHHEDCGCGHPGHHVIREGWHHQYGCCCHAGYHVRRFPTKEEMIARMEDYLEQLRGEIKYVEERLAEIKKTQA